MADRIISYQEFLERKSQSGSDAGFDPVWMPDFLFDFQRSLVDWAVRKGRAALFADCGLGKTPMQLVWAENIVRHTNGRVLILTPLAVSTQTQREADKFGIEAHKSHEGKVYGGITITNYEQLHKFDPSQFAGVVCDESSILKSFNGKRRSEITQFMRKISYRLLCTATAAPNDFIELGTSSEALGYMGYMDMLNKFFRQDNNTSSTTRGYLGAEQKWRFKGHAEIAFWRWVCSWARAIRSPSDIGFDDDHFILPELLETEFLVESRVLPDGMLFDLPAATLQEQREEMWRTLRERCEKIANRVNDTKSPALVWCHLNEEGDYLERIIPDGLQVKGSQSDDVKEDRLMAFADGKARVLITKPKIGAWGLNFQHCSHVTFFPSHSFEQYYQGVRRCWRFGQRRPVRVDMVITEGQRGILNNLQRKADNANRMFSNLVSEMNNALNIRNTDFLTKREEIPSWL